METNLCVAGFGGQGVMTLGKFLASATCDSTEKNVTFFPSYGAEQRGGTANCYVVISDEIVGAPLGDVMDDLIVMNGPSLDKFLGTLKPGGTLFINSSIVSDQIDRDDVKVVKAPVTELALEMGNAKVLNVIMLGVYVGYTEVIAPEIVWDTIEHKLSKKSKLLPLNKQAFEKGLEIGRSQKEECQMVLKNYDELVAKVKAFPAAKRVVVAAAGDQHTLEAVVEAQKEGIVIPVLVGDKTLIREISTKIGLQVADEDIYDVADPDAAAAKAVALIHEGKGDFIMKGKLETSQILKPVVNKETGLGTGRVMSHFVLDELPNYHKLIVTTDGGMMTYPTLEQKKDIIINTVETLKALGYENPKIACVACVEKVNPKMPETVEAHELQEMNERGEIPDCTVCGPISLDIALDKEIADLKGFEHPVAGDADAIIVPNIHVGNVLGKSITVIAKGRMAGFIVGAKVPIVLTSRGSSAEEKFLSLVLASAVSAAK